MTIQTFSFLKKKNSLYFRLERAQARFLAPLLRRRVRHVIFGQRVEEAIRPLTDITEPFFELAEQRLSAHFLAGTLKTMRSMNPVLWYFTGSHPAHEHVPLPGGETVAGIERDA